MEFDCKKQVISLNGILYSRKDILKLDKVPSFSGDNSFDFQIYSFLQDWFSDSDHIQIQTSGSTGKPKCFNAGKIEMMQSAKLTCEFLGLKHGDSALLCLPVSAIAGKMMLVRSLVTGLKLLAVKPSGHPLENLDSPLDFAAMIPLQVYNSLTEVTEKDTLRSIRNLIVGGAAIDPHLESALAEFSNRIYSTYGMTETLSHIALRRLNGKDASSYYIPFSSVKIGLSPEQCLTIDAPLIYDGLLTTTDLAEINSDGSFRILGRIDNVINSGGVKIQMEEVEQKLKSILDISLAITSYVDVKFGEIVILLIEVPFNEKLLDTVLSSYEIPKQILLVDKIPLTHTQKIDRVACKELAKLIIENSLY